ncbi:MAG: PQQ-binding-like beta-propeller repeat protein [Candidatus Bathyarchaeota archaeon]|nr:PQQ-binding-like beta-propeller repeat protein [Candidatus Bathyarchaeota archaeon]
MQLAKKTTTAIALFLILTFAVSLVALPAINTVNAEITWHPYLTAAPNPVGVGQRVLIVFGFTMPTLGFGFRCYEDWTLTITDPNGKAETISGLDAESTGSTFYVFYPDKVGTWKLKAHYPGGYADFGFNIQSFNVSVPAADTNEFSLTVQQDPVPEYPGSPLPTEYWQFPIYGENREWYQIAGNWLLPGYDTGRQFDWGAVSGAFNPYTTVPNTGHILWTKSNLYGGIVGGATNKMYYTGSSYRRELQPPVVINGRLYYKVMEPPRHGWYCVDLATGETIWYVNGTYPTATGGLVQGQDAQITAGQVLTYDTRNWHGGLAYLWSTGATTWAVWDAWSGNLLYTIVNAPAISTDSMGMTLVPDPITGSLYTYQYDATTDTVIKWNSSKMLDKSVSATLANIGRERPTYNIDWRTGIEWNVTLPDIGPVSRLTVMNHDPKDLSVLIISNQSQGDIYNVGAFVDLAFSGKDGHVLWQKVRNEGTWENVVGGRAMSMEDGVYAIVRKETRQVYVYDVNTGEKKWVSDPRPNQWGLYITGAAFAYGKLYVIAYDGECYAYNAKTGKVEWVFGPISSGLETPYGVYPFYGGLTIADNKIILCHGEHSADSPMYRGEHMYIVNATNGELIWDMLGWYQQPVAANGVVLAPNCYDGKIYCFGKGPSATTVSASPKVSVHGDNVLIEGTVMDISAGAKQNEQAARFPFGVPAVSDECMSAWMEYVYMQKPMPTNATGVTVTLSVVDANNNYREIGTATSGADGFFSFVWKPDIPGKYTVYASFAGSGSYWPSSAVTAFTVDAAPEPTPAPTPTPASMADLYFMPMSVGLIIAIAVVIALLAMMLFRKRP